MGRETGPANELLAPSLVASWLLLLGFGEVGAEPTLPPPGKNGTSKVELATPS